VGSQPDNVSEVRASEVIVFRGGRRQRIVYNNDEQLAATLAGLRDEGLPFVDVGHGWPPAEVFAFLRERGLITGRYDAITWNGPGDCRVTSGQ
jgi:hypothetical protein